MKKLNLGCGSNIKEGYVNVDKLSGDNENIVVWDIEKDFSPLSISLFRNDTFDEILAEHVLEHIKPWNFIDVMNRLHSLMKNGGVMHVSTPIPGSWLWWQDPTHYNGIGEMTFQYFDPETEYYDMYKPFPWAFLDYRREILETPEGHKIPIECHEFVLRCVKQ